MTVSDENLDEVLLIERERWPDGPPHELFKRMRGECPVHWTSHVPEFPESAGFWSITTADDVHAVSRDWQTYSSEIGGMTALKNAIMPLELQQAMFIGMDPPKHDRLKAMFQRGFTPKRIAEHEDQIREITRTVLDRLDGQDECDLVVDVAQPVVAGSSRRSTWSRWPMRTPSGRSAGARGQSSTGGRSGAPCGAVHSASPPGGSVPTADLNTALAELAVGCPPDLVHLVPDMALSASYRPLLGPLRAAGIPKPSRNAWYLDTETDQYRRLTAAARAELTS